MRGQFAGRGAEHPSDASTGLDERPGDLFSNGAGSGARVDAEDLLCEAAQRLSGGDEAGHRESLDAAEARARDAAAEKQVAGLLATLSGDWRVLHSVRADHVADPLSHLLIGTYGLVVVRVRDRRGSTVTVAMDDVLVDGVRCRDVQAARDEAWHVSEHLWNVTGVRVMPRPVVVYTGQASMAVLADPHDVHVMAADGLVEALSDALDLANLTGHTTLSDEAVEIVVEAARRESTWQQAVRRRIAAEAASHAAAVAPVPRRSRLRGRTVSDAAAPAAPVTGSPEIWSPGQVPLDEVARQAAARQAAARQVPSKVQMPRTGSAFSRLPSEQVAAAQRAAAIQFGAGPMPEPTPLKRILRGQENPTKVEDLGWGSRVGVGLIGVGGGAGTAMVASPQAAAAATESLLSDSPAATSSVVPGR